MVREPLPIGLDTGWAAALELAYALRDGQTVPVRRWHEGPLRVQKHFYPEGPAVCQQIIVHPPGGIAGGDRLRIDLEVGPGAQVQLTSPGAAKWYHGYGRSAEQALTARVADAALLEWLPQETILFNGAQPRLTNRFELQGNARLMLCDVVCLGRNAGNQPFQEGVWQQHSQITRDGRLLWHEQIRCSAEDGWLQHALGMGGFSVVGNLLWVGPALDTEQLEACRAVTAAGQFGVTQLADIGMARIVCAEAEAAHAWLRAIWALVRPHVAGRAAVPPRIWQT